jgi:hypothetical protein
MTGSVEVFRMRVVVISPFRGVRGGAYDEAQHRRYLSACLADSLGRNEAPFAGHGLYALPGVLDDSVAEERRRGMGAGRRWMSVAEMGAAYIDLGWSEGMQADRAYLRGLGIDVIERSLLGWPK